MSSTSNFKILADVGLNLGSIDKDIEKIKEKLKSQKINIIDASSVNTASTSLNNLSNSAKNVSKSNDELNESNKKVANSANEVELSVDAASRVLRKTVEIITSMVSQVFELDSALTEFKKVSDLSGDSLDNYVDKLSKMGESVARTGKPNRSEPVCTDGKCA